MSLKEFPKEVKKHLGCYVYRLIDPRNGDTFYVGKGQRDRVFAHANAEIDNDTEDANDPKLKRIREIKNAGFEVVHIIHRHGLNEDTAFEVEAALIDAYPEAENKVGGRGSNEHGIMHAEQVIEQYRSEETDFHGHKVLMLTINHSALEADSIYEAVRSSWRLKVERAKEAEYVLAVIKGLVVGVFVPEKWFGNPGRWSFEGKEAPDNIKKLFMRTRVPESMRKKGAMFPARYSY